MTTAVGKVSLAKQIAGVIKEHIAKAFTVLRTDIEASKLQHAEHLRRLAELEAGHVKTLADAHRGAWTSGERYARGELVTDHGSCWLCLSATSARPGNTSDWRLIVKRGADAR